MSMKMYPGGPAVGMSENEAAVERLRPTTKTVAHVNGSDVLYFPASHTLTWGVHVLARKFQRWQRAPGYSECSNSEVRRIVDQYVDGTLELERG